MSKVLEPVPDNGDGPEEKPRKRSFWCVAGFHNWSRWSKTEIKIVGGDKPPYSVTHNQRTCQGCNKYQITSIH